MARISKMEDARLGTGYEKKECPKCGEEKNVDDEFGYRQSKGKIIAQSWCASCRGVSAVLGPQKRWDGFSEAAVKEKIEAKRELFRKPRKEKPVKDARERANEIMGEAARKTLGVAPKTKTAKPAPAPKNAPPASPKITPPAAVSDDKVIWISADLGTTKVLFKKHFPDDKQMRSWKTMVNRLIAKLGDRAKLTPTAEERIGQ